MIFLVLALVIVFLVPAALKFRSAFHDVRRPLP